MSKIKTPKISLTNRRTFLAASAAFTILPSYAAKAQEFDIEAITAPRRIGAPDAPIKVVEFFSMTCSHCGSFHRNTYPQIKSDLIDTGQVEFEMHPFPLDGLALRAHVMCRLLPNKGYFAMTELLLKEQKTWVRAEDPLKALMNYARQAGISEEKFNAVMRSRPVLEAVVAMRQQAMDDWKISSTPSFVVNNDKMISGSRSYDDFVTELNINGI